MLTERVVPTSQPQPDDLAATTMPQNYCGNMVIESGEQCDVGAAQQECPSTWGACKACIACQWQLQVAETRENENDWFLGSVCSQTGAQLEVVRNDRGRMIKMVETKPPRKAIETFRARYNADGQALSTWELMDGVRHEMRWQYDSQHRAIRREYLRNDKSNSTVTRSFDARGNVSTVHDSNGTDSHHEYDADGRLIKTVETFATIGQRKTTTYTYHPNGNFLEVNDGHDVQKFLYDSANRRTSVSAFLVADGQLSSVTSFSYDRAGNLLRTESANKRSSEPNVVHEFTYDAANLRISESLNAYGQLTSRSYSRKDQHGYGTAWHLQQRNKSVAMEIVRDEQHRVLTERRTDDGKITLRHFTYDPSGGKTEEITLTDGSAITVRYHATGVAIARTQNGVTCTAQPAAIAYLEKLWTNLPTAEQIYENKITDQVKSLNYTMVGFAAR